MLFCAGSRCGKSSLLELYHRYLLEQGVAESHIIHMNLESLRYWALTDYLAFYDYVSPKMPNSGKTYLIFDELQAVSHWEKAIESFRLDYDVDIYIKFYDGIKVLNLLDWLVTWN